MDGQGENIMPNGTGNQVPSDGMPLNIPSHGSNTQANNIAYSNNSQPTAESNVAQHVLGDISSSQPLTTPAEPITTPPEAITTPAAPLTQSAESWTMPSNATISSADVPDPELTPESAPGETARIHAALSHPYFSNHPTQTSASGVGDIVIDNQPRDKTHKFNITRGKLVGIALAILVVVGAIVLVASSNGSDPRSVLEESRDLADSIEDILPMTDLNTMDFGVFFSESTSEKLNSQISSYATLQMRVSKIKEDHFSQNNREKVVQLKEKMAHNAIVYRAFLETYNQIYAAFGEKNIGYFETLKEDDSSNLSFIGERILEYYTIQNYWSTFITEHSCDQPDVVDYIVDCELATTYMEEEAMTLNNTTPVVRSLGDEYQNLELGVGDLISEILGEMSEEK